jgi:hypothetical protein
VVEGAPLLREYTRKGIEGSNPFLSAIGLRDHLQQSPEYCHSRPFRLLVQRLTSPGQPIISRQCIPFGFAWEWVIHARRAAQPLPEFLGLGKRSLMRHFMLRLIGKVPALAASVVRAAIENGAISPA